MLNVYYIKEKGRGAARIAPLILPIFVGFLISSCGPVSPSVDKSFSLRTKPVAPVPGNVVSHEVVLLEMDARVDKQHTKLAEPEDGEIRVILGTQEDEAAAPLKTLKEEGEAKLEFVGSKITHMRVLMDFEASDAEGFEDEIKKLVLSFGDLKQEDNITILPVKLEFREEASKETKELLKKKLSRVVLYLKGDLQPLKAKDGTPAQPSHPTAPVPGPNALPVITL